MIRRLKQYLLTAVAAVMLVGGIGVLAPSAVYADASTDAARKIACEGAGGTWSGGNCTTKGPSLNGIIANVVNILSILVGIAAVIMIMVGGFKYVTANGDSSNVGSAKQTITYAVIGLVIVVFAQVIVQFVIKETTQTVLPVRFLG